MATPTLNYFYRDFTPALGKKNRRFCLTNCSLEQTVVAMRTCLFCSVLSSVKNKVYYGVIKKSLCTRWLQYRKLQVIFKVSPADRQGQRDTRLTLTPSSILNSNYVIMVSNWNCLKYFACFFTVIIRCTETFWSPCIYLNKIKVSWGIK
jgi:hypothetical protein